MKTAWRSIFYLRGRKLNETGEKQEMRTEFWVGNLMERDRMGFLFVHGSKPLSFRSDGDETSGSITTRKFCISVLYWTQFIVCGTGVLQSSLLYSRNVVFTKYTSEYVQCPI